MVLLQFGIPGGTELLFQLLINGLLAALFGVVAFVVAGRRDPDHRLAWTGGTAGAALLPWIGGLVVLLLLIAVTVRSKVEHRTACHRSMALETLLLAVGGKSSQVERLASVAEDIAGPAGARVVLGHVFTEDDYSETLDRLEFDDDVEVTPDTVAGRTVAVRDLRSRFTAADIDVDHRGTVGEPAAGVITFAEETDADLLVVGGRRRSPTGKAVFGSTAQEVLLDAPCPVTFVKRPIG